MQRSRDIGGVTRFIQIAVQIAVWEEIDGKKKRFLYWCNIEGVERGSGTFRATVSAAVTKF